MGLRIVARNSLNPGAIALLILALAITAGAGCSNGRDTPSTFREELAESRTDSGEPAPTSTTEVAVQPTIPDDTRRSQTDAPQIEEPQETPTQNPQMGEANRSAGIKNLFTISSGLAPRRQARPLQAGIELSFAVLPESAALFQPGEPLHHPSLRQYYEGVHPLRFTTSTDAPSRLSRSPV